MTLLEWRDRAEDARIVAGELTDPIARKAVLQPDPMCVFEPRLGQFVPAARSSQQAAISGLASATTTANRTEEPRHTLSAFIYVISVALVAATTIVGFGIASFSLLYTSKEMPSSVIRDWGVEVKPVLPGVVPYPHANAASAPAETTLPSPAVEAALRASLPRVRQSISCNRPRSAGHNWVLSNQGLVPAGRAPQKMPLGVERCRRYLFLPHNGTRSSASSRWLLSNYAGFRSDRLRKECGPIKDSQLLDHCVRSFRAQYPVHRR